MPTPDAMLSSQAAVNAKSATPLPSPAAPRPGAGTGPSFSQMLTVQAPAPTSAAPAQPVPAQAAAPGPSPAAQPPTQPKPAPAQTTAEQKAAASESADKPVADKPDTPTKVAHNGTNKASAQAQNKAKPDTPADATTRAGAKTTDDLDTKPETAGLDEFTSLINLPAAMAAPVDAAAAVAAAQAALQTATQVVPITHPGAMDDTTATSTADVAGDTAARTDGTDTRTSRRAGNAVQATDTGAAQARSADLATGQDAKSARSGEALAEAGKPHDVGQSAPIARPAQDAVLASSFAASLQAATAHAAAPTASTSDTTHIGAPLQSPTFAPEVAARVSLLAVDGVQQAELQLNPADMGPVSVQIVMDGTQAQVSFHAAHAETRQALEQSLPDLAAALQGQGLTLSGGGVFQQAPRERGDGKAEADGNGARSGSRSVRGAGGGQAVESVAAAPARRTVGLLDQFV